MNCLKCHGRLDPYSGAYWCQRCLDRLLEDDPKGAAREDRMNHLLNMGDDDEGDAELQPA